MSGKTIRFKLSSHAKTDVSGMVLIQVPQMNSPVLVAGFVDGSLSCFDTESFSCLGSEDLRCVCVAEHPYSSVEEPHSSCLVGLRDGQGVMVLSAQVNEGNVTLVHEERFGANNDIVTCVATSGARQIVAFGTSNVFSFHRANSWECVLSYSPGISQCIMCICCAGPDVWSGCEDGRVAISARGSDRESYTTEVQESAHTSIVTTLVAFKGYVLSGADDGTVVMWDANQRSPIETFDIHRAAITMICAVDESLLLSADASGASVLWNYRGGTIQRAPSAMDFSATTGYPSFLRKMPMSSVCILAGTLKGFATTSLRLSSAPSRGSQTKLKNVAHATTQVTSEDNEMRSLIEVKDMMISQMALQLEDTQRQLETLQSQSVNGEAKKAADDRLAKAQAEWGLVEKQLREDLQRHAAASSELAAMRERAATAEAQLETTTQAFEEHETSLLSAQELVHRGQQSIADLKLRLFNSEVSRNASESTVTLLTNTVNALYEDQMHNTVAQHQQEKPAVSPSRWRVMEEENRVLQEEVASLESVLAQQRSAGRAEPTELTESIAAMMGILGKESAGEIIRNADVDGELTLEGLVRTLSELLLVSSRADPYSAALADTSSVATKSARGLLMSPSQED